MRLRSLAVLAALFASTAVLAQDNTEAMLASARQMRATAEQMKGQLPAADLAEMLRAADEIEANARAGLYRGADTPPGAEAAPADTATRLQQEHGKVDWLMGEPACVGYQWENWRTFHLTSGDRDAERDRLCKAAFQHYETWFLAVRDGRSTPETDAELDAYDRAAKDAIRFFEGG